MPVDLITLAAGLVASWALVFLAVFGGLTLIARRGAPRPTTAATESTVAEGAIVYVPFDGRGDEGDPFAGALAAAAPTVVVDLSGADHVSVNGVCVLARASRQLAGHGRQLVVLSGGEEVSRDLKQTGLDRLVPVLRSRAELGLVTNG